MASPEALQHRAQSLALSLQRRTSCTLREAVRSRAIQISREHLADDFLSRRLSKADYNSLISLAAEEVLTWPAAVGGPLQQGASGATDELFRQKVVAFLDAKKLLLEQHVPAACHAAKNGWSSEPCQPRWPASAPGLMARESEAVCTHTPALASARQSAPPPAVPPVSPPSLLATPSRIIPPPSQVSTGSGPAAGERSLLLRFRLPWAPLSDGAAKSGDTSPAAAQTVKLFAAAAGQRTRPGAILGHHATLQLRLHALTQPPPHPNPNGLRPNAQATLRPLPAPLCTTPSVRRRSSPYHVTLLSHAGFAACLASRGPSPALRLAQSRRRRDLARWGGTGGGGGHRMGGGTGIDAAAAAVTAGGRLLDRLPAPRRARAA